jgi:hypothetical protein
MVAAFPHNAAKSRDQFRCGATQFFVMMKRQLAKNLLASGGKIEQNFAAVVLGARAMDKSCGFETVYQFHRAVMPDFHATG